MRWVVGINRRIEYESAKQTDPSIRKQGRQFLEYGEAKEGYWTAGKFMDQIKQAVKIAEAKYPRRWMEDCLAL